MEFIDEYISDDAMSTLEILQNHPDDINKILDYNIRPWLFKDKKNYRIFVDDITKDIIYFFERNDEDICNMIIWESILDGDFKNREYAKYYNFNGRLKISDSNFINIKVNYNIWKNFINLSKEKELTIEDLFKISIIRFLERRLEYAKSLSLISTEDIDNDNDIWFMDNEIEKVSSLPMIHG